jgi:hypothetical protein
MAFHKQQPMGVENQFEADKSLRTLEGLLLGTQIKKVVGSILDVAI